MPIVQLPDGTHVELPELGEQPPDLPSRIGRQLRLAGSNAVQGAAALPGLGIDAARWLANKGLGTEPGYQFGQHMAGIQGGAEELFGVKPESLGEKRVASIVQGVAGAAGPGFSAAPVRSIVAGAAGGAGSQLAGELFQDNPIAKLAGGLLGGLAGAQAGNFFGGVRPQVKTLAEEAVTGLSPKQLAEAKAFMEDAAKEGVKVDLAQALEAVGAPQAKLTSVRNVLANSRWGDKVREVVEEQPSQYLAATNLQTLSMPGKAVTPTQAATSVQQAATAAINAAKKARSAAVKPLYEKAGELTDVQRSQLIALVNKLAAEPGAPTALKQEAGTFAAKLRGLTTAEAKELADLERSLGRTTTPDQRLAAQAAIGELERRLGLQPGGMGAVPDRTVRALDVDQAISELVGPYRGTPLSPVDPKLSGAMRRVGKRLNEAFQGMSPDVKAAEAEFARISKEVVNPLKQSVVGRMAGRGGYKGDLESPASRLESVLSKGTDPKSASSDILNLAKSLNAQDKTVFPDAVKTHLSMKLSEAFGPELKDIPDTSAGMAEKVWTSLFFPQTKWQGLKDMAAGVADAQDIPRKDLVNGLEVLGRLTKALRNTPPPGGLSREEIHTMSKASLPANIVRLWGFLPTERLARRIEDKQIAATLGKFDELLTTPEGAQLLSQIGRRSVMDPEVLVLLAGFQGGASAGITPP